MNYRLVDHKKFGLGVVLSRDSYLISVLFADGTRRDLLEDSRYYNEDTKFTLYDFIKSNIFEYLFDSFTKTKAKKYMNAHHINRLSLENNKYSGIVIGNYQYYLNLSIKNNFVTLDCGCPVNGLCKHEYAFLKVVREKILTKNELINSESKINSIECDIYCLIDLDRNTTLVHFLNLLEYLSNANIDKIKEYLSYFPNEDLPDNNKIILYGISPLFFKDKFKEMLLSLIADENFSRIIKYAYSQFNEKYINPHKNFEMLASTLRSLVLEDILTYVDIKLDFRTNYSFLSRGLMYLLSKREYRPKTLFIVSCSNLCSYFDFFDLSFEYKIPEKNKIALLKSVHLDDKVFSLFDISELLYFVLNVGQYTGLINYLNRNFDKINKEYYQLLVNNLYVRQLNEFHDDDTVSLISKLPNSSFLIELFANKNRYDRY